MAAGKPVVSTSIRDVVRPYGQQGLVRIADDVPAFVDACAAAMAEDAQRAHDGRRRLPAADVVGRHLDAAFAAADATRRCETPDGARPRRCSRG